MTSSVVVHVLAEPATGVTLKAQNASFTRVTLQHNDDWDAILPSLTGDTQKVVHALKGFNAIEKLILDGENIRITCDSNRSLIEDAVAAALHAELKEFIPPPSIRIRDLIGRRH